MKIALFTSNEYRHNYFINRLNKKFKNLTVILNNNKKKKNSQNKFISDYFDKIKFYEKKIFGNINNDNLKKKINFLDISNLKKINLYNLKKLNYDLYIAYGSEYFTGNLKKFLIRKKTICIHMGIAPYYLGPDSNFWAMYDNNIHLVGSTFHQLYKKKDSGPILFHFVGGFGKNKYSYGMYAAKFALNELCKRINKKFIVEYKNIKLIRPNYRFSKKSNLNEKIIKNFLNKKINFKKLYSKELLVNPVKKN